MLEKLCDLTIPPIEGDFIEGFFKGLKNIDLEFSDNVVKYKDLLQHFLQIKERERECIIEKYVRDIEAFHFKSSLYFKALGLWLKKKSCEEKFLFYKHLMEETPNMMNSINMALVKLFMSDSKPIDVINTAIIWDKEQVEKDKLFGSFTVNINKSCLICLLSDLNYLEGVKAFIIEGGKGKKSISLTIPTHFLSPLDKKIKEYIDN